MTAVNNAAARSSEQNARQGFDFKSLAFYAVLALAVVNAFGVVQTKEAEGFKETSTSGVERPATHNAQGSRNEAAALRTVGRRLVPLAHPGDAFSIRVNVDHGLFDPVEFNDLVFDHAFLSTGKFNKTVSMDMTACVAQNCSADVHVFWSLRGKSFSASAPLIRFYATKHVEGRHLFGGNKKAGNQSKTTASTSGRVVYRSYLLPSLTLSPVVDFTTPLPPQLEQFTPVDESTLQYGPLVYINDFWVIRDRLRELNATTAAVQPYLLDVTILPLPMWKLAMYKQFEASMKAQSDMGFSAQDAADETKRIFLETNPYFLMLTGLVTVMHVLFEYLAFANDIKFWRGRKDFSGLSLRSIIVNCYFQTIVFLYLVDSNETSWTVLLPSAFGVLAEFWKLTQCVVFTKQTRETAMDETQEVAAAKAGSKQQKKDPVLSLLGYSVHFSGSYDKRTRRHDDTAVRWLMRMMIPALIGYSIYSAVYNEHKSWYSYLINTQVQFIYFFGFAMMTPQIFINYKLKSVGQLPWRTFVYKALNTVIDDLFAFVVKMPWLHRLACFRDDVVFVVLLYQRWIYPVDMRRMADDDGEVAEEIDEEEEQRNEQRQQQLPPLPKGGCSSTGNGEDTLKRKND